MSETREHILKVAFSLFLRKSYKEVTMAELVEKSGMSKGAFYHYFESKEQLFFESLNQSFSSFIPDFTKFSKDSLYEFYHQYILFFNKTLNTFKSWENDSDSDLTANYYWLIFDALKIFPNFQEKLLEEEQNELKAWTEVIALARKNKEINSNMNDEQIAKVFIYTNDGVAIRGMLKKVSNDETSSTLLALWDSLYEEVKA